MTRRRQTVRPPDVLPLALSTWFIIRQRIENGFLSVCGLSFTHMSPHQILNESNIPFALRRPRFPGAVSTGVVPLGSSLCAAPAAPHTARLNEIDTAKREGRPSRRRQKKAAPQGERGLPPAALDTSVSGGGTCGPCSAHPGEETLQDRSSHLRRAALHASFQKYGDVFSGESPFTRVGPIF